MNYRVRRIFLVGACLAAGFSGCVTPPGTGEVRRGPPIQIDIAVKKTPAQEPRRDVADPEAAALIARMEAQIRRQIAEYQKSPRKTFVGAKVRDNRYAQYLEDWRTKIERVGNENYPNEARGKVYGSVRLTASIRPDGTVESVAIERSSGHEILDRAALRITGLASPFAPFPPEISRETDLLVITRTWYFAPGNSFATSPCSDDDLRLWRLAANKAIRANVRYPQEAIAEKREGRVEVEVYVDATGKLLQAAIMKSSGSAVLDAEALAAARKTAFPAASCGVQVIPTAHVVPIVFALDKGDLGPADSIQDWTDRVSARVRANLSVPPSTPSDAEASFSVVQLPTGEILNVKMLSSSGFEPYDEETRLAIWMSSPLPRAAPAVFSRDLVFRVRP